MRWGTHTHLEAVQDKCGENIIDFSQFLSGPANNPETNPVGHWPWMASIGKFANDKKWIHQPKVGSLLKL